MKAVRPHYYLIVSVGAACGQRVRESGAAGRWAVDVPQHCCPTRRRSGATYQLPMAAARYSIGMITLRCGVNSVVGSMVLVAKHPQHHQEVEVIVKRAGRLGKTLGQPVKSKSAVKRSASGAMHMIACQAWMIGHTCGGLKSKAGAV